MGMLFLLTSVLADSLYANPGDYELKAVASLHTGDKSYRVLLKEDELDLDTSHKKNHEGVETFEVIHATDTKSFLEIISIDQQQRYHKHRQHLDIIIIDIEKDQTECKPLLRQIAKKLDNIMNNLYTNIEKVEANLEFIESQIYYLRFYLDALKDLSKAVDTCINESKRDL